MAEAAVLSQPADVASKPVLSLDAELAQYDRILTLRDEILAGNHPRIKLPALPQAAIDAVPKRSQLPNGKHASPTQDKQNVLPIPQPAANDSRLAQPKPPSPAAHSSGLNPIFLQESEVVVKAKMKLERQRIERSLQEQTKKKEANRQRVSDQDILPDFDVTDVYFQALEAVKPIQASQANTAHRRIPSADTVDDNTYYSSQVNDSNSEESDELAKRRATKPCKFYFEGSCKKGNKCTFSHDPAFKQKLQANVHADTSERDNGPNAQGPTRGYTAKGGRIRDSPTYDSRESGELVEDSPYSPAMQVPVEDLPRRPYNDQNGRAKHDGHMQRTKSQTDGRRTRRATPLGRNNRVVRNHITSPAAPQPTRVSPLAVAKVSRVDRAFHYTGEPSPRQPRQSASGQPTPVIDSAPRSRKRRRELESTEITRNVAPRRQPDSPVPYIKEEPVSPPLQAVPASRALQREELRRPIEMGPPSPRYGERVVYQPVSEEYGHSEAPGLRRISSPSIRRVVSGPAHQEVYREPDLRRVVSTRYIERPVSPRHDFVSVSGQPRSSRAMSHYAAPAPDEAHYAYRSPVQPTRPTYVHDERPASPVVRYVRQPPAESEIVSMPPPTARRIIVDEYGNQFYEAPVSDRRASMMPEARYAPEPPQHVEQAPLGRASVRPENVRVFHDDGYIRRAVSPPPTQPQYVQYRSSVQPSSQRIYEHDGASEYRSRPELVRVVEHPQERRLQREGEYERPLDGIVRMQSVRPNEIAYEGPSERYRVQTVQPEQRRYIDAPRDGPAYLREVREVSVRPEGPYGGGVREYVDQPPPGYQYVSARPVSRAVDREVLMR